MARLRCLDSTHQSRYEFVAHEFGINTNPHPIEVVAYGLLIPSSSTPKKNNRNKKSPILPVTWLGIWGSKVGSQPGHKDCAIQIPAQRTRIEIDVLNLRSEGEPTILRSLACTGIPRKSGDQHKEVFQRVHVPSAPCKTKWPVAVSNPRPAESRRR